MQSPAVRVYKPCAITLAAFSDVPYILDSIWRRAEFEAYRIGRVNPNPEASFTQEHTTPWPFYVAYLVVSSFIVFGPTFTTLCNSFGLRSAEVIRWVLAGIVILVTTLVVLAVSVEICARLARRAGQQMAQEPAKEEAVASSRFLELAQAFGRTSAELPEWYVRRLKSIGELRKNFRALAKTSVRARRAVKVRLLTAFVLLFLGVGLVATPLVIAGIDLGVSVFDPHVCPARPAGTAVLIQGAVQLVSFLVLAELGRWLWMNVQPTFARTQLLGISCLWLVAAVVLLLIAHGNTREATGGPYPQTYTVLLMCLMLVVFGAQGLARLAIAGVSPQTRTDLQQALTTTQLFEGRRTEPELSRLRILSAIINGVVYHPLHLLLLPSFAALLVPTQYLVFWVVLFALLAVMLLAHGSVSPRWEELIRIVQRWFLSGTPLLVSIAVITIAILCLLDVQYVSTIIDAAPVGVISTLVLGAYMTLWFFEYWVNRWIAEELLGILGAPQRGRTGRVAYPCPASPPGPAVVLAQGRVIALQSIGEFCVQGVLYRPQPLPGESAYDIAFTTYRLTDLFQRLAPETAAANDVTRRVKAFFAVVNLTLILLAGGFAYLHRWSDRPLNAYPVLQASETATPELGQGGADLRALLERQAGQQRPALIIAASGGGTRAALYAATALQGLAQIDRTRDIVLLSGVSGGGVSVAYFAKAYSELQSPDAPARCTEGQPCPWARFKELVTEPFIQDVLDGVDELRIAGTVPLGTLLSESLERRVFREHETFEQLRGPGLILNTTISGHPWTDSEIINGHVSILRPNDPAQPFSSLAGSRLIFTNLMDVQGFPRAPWVMPDIGLAYKVVRDPTVPLATAAELNANFPPVFSNARVCLGERDDGGCRGSSYYVTDGGATENLGLVSALYELRGVLDSWRATPERAGKGSEASKAPPQIDVIAIEASAITYDYSDDRGVGAATGGSKERINGGLTAELVEGINKRLHNLGAPSLRLHYLPLPVAFRSRGGFGTHWMWARKIRVSNPLVVDLGNRASQFGRQKIGYPTYAYLDHGDVSKLWDALFDPHAGFCDIRFAGTAEMHRVAQWVCGCSPEWKISAEPDIQIAAWRQLMADLGQALPMSTDAHCGASPASEPGSVWLPRR